MYIIRNLLFVTGASVLLFSCEKDKSNPPATQAEEGKLTLQFQNSVAGAEIIPNMMDYTNAAGNAYSISLLKYYVSRIKLHSSTGTDKMFEVYELIDAFDPASQTIATHDILTGQYDSISFYLGIPKDRNHSGAQDGDLDVSKGMFWTWNTGYIFFKHEGQFKNSSDQTKSLLFHYATDEALSSVTLPLNLNMSTNRTVNIAFDLNKLYESPNQIDFNVDNNRQSTSGADATWIAALKENFTKAFEIKSVE